MAKLVECVPNFSEGNNKEVIDALGQAISRTPGCVLLDVDAGASTNRTVYTFVGSPEAVVEGALSAARTAGQLIDMSQHKGEHPRMGALDVCPFVPVMNISMEECVTCAHIFGQRLAAELGVPVFLYGEAAREDSRKALPTIRAGEYEALPFQPFWVGKGLLEQWRTAEWCATATKLLMGSSAREQRQIAVKGNNHWDFRVQGGEKKPQCAREISFGDVPCSKKGPVSWD